MHPGFQGISYNYVSSIYRFPVYLSNHKSACIRIFLFAVPKRFQKLSGSRVNIPRPRHETPPERLADTLTGVSVLLRLGLGTPQEVCIRVQLWIAHAWEPPFPALCGTPPQPLWGLPERLGSLAQGNPFALKKFAPERPAGLRLWRFHALSRWVMRWAYCNGYTDTRNSA